MVRDLSLHQTVVAVVAIVGISILAALGVVDPSVVVAIYGTVLGGAVGYINGKKSKNILRINGDEGNGSEIHEPTAIVITGEKVKPFVVKAEVKPKEKNGQSAPQVSD